MLHGCLEQEGPGFLSSSRPRRLHLLSVERVVVGGGAAAAGEGSGTETLVLGRCAQSYSLLVSIAIRIARWT